jgi:hypothetical protein
MNLHLIVSGAVGTINLPILLSIAVSTGYTTASDGTQAPTYAAPVSAYGDMQALSYKDIQQLSGLNIQGVKQKIYINGRIDGLIRSENKGGDLITLPDGSVYLVSIILEYWDSWCCAGICLQNGS